MKFSLFLAACVGATFTLMLGGCADQTQTSQKTVSQKPAARQTSTYNPYYQTPGMQGQPSGQNVVTSRNEVVAQKPTMPVSTSPLTVAPPMEAKEKAAILLPLTGKNAALGQAMLNAAQQAVFDAAGNNFELQPRDTAGDGGAVEAARGALADGAQLIIGPLFATDVPSVVAVAQSGGLQVLPLSTDTSLAEPGVYVMGLAPGAQVERVVAYAAAHGAHNFAALIPTTPYGNLVGQVFATSVSQHGGVVVDSESYDPVARQGPDHIKALISQKDRIDAVFLPEGGNDLKMIVDQLGAGGFDANHVHLLGTGLWDVPGFGKQSPLLLGGWYAAPDPATRRTFMTSYQAAYGQEPPRLATLAYDATALAAILAKHGTNYDQAALTNPNGFAGLDGIFRLTPSGVVERALAVNEVTADGAKVIDAAPSSFVVKNR